MIEVEMSDDIRKYDTNFIGSFSKRQCISLGLGCLLAIPIALALPLSMDNKVFIGFAIALPIILCGWIKMDGMPFEVFIIRYIYRMILTPRKRKYKSKNAYRKYYDKIKASKNGSATALKSKKNAVKYSQKKQYRIYK